MAHLSGRTSYSGWVWWLVLGISLVIGGLPLITAPPLSLDADLVEFSAERARAHVEAIAVEPHPMGSSAAATVRSYLVEQLKALALEVEEQDFEAQDYFGSPGGTVEGVNVLARLPGTDSSGALLFIAHHDSVPQTPGANDNASAVAALIESARVLSTSPPVRNDIIFLFTDGEEPAPKFGANAFIEAHPWFEDAALMINLEANGGAGPSQLVEVSGSERDLVSQFTEVDTHPVAYSYITEITELIGEIGTDFDPFSEEGVPGLAFAYMHNSPIYHTDRDSIENLGLGSLQHHGAHVVALAHHFGNSDLNEAVASEGANYLTVADWRVVMYPDSWNLPVALMALLVLIRAIVIRGRAKMAIRQGANTFGAFLAALVAGGLAWYAVGSLRSSMSPMESYLYFVALLSLGAWATVRATKKSHALDQFLGVLVIWLVLGTAAAVWAPGLSYLFVWPALTGAVMIATSGWPSAIARYLSLAVIVVLNLSWIDFIIQFSQPRPGGPDSEMLPLGGAAFAFALLAVLAIRATIKGPTDTGGLSTP